jgi:hypothetical protein
MSVSRRIALAVAAALSLLLLLSPEALAAPITVNLRVEGSSKTVFEGPVATEGEEFATKSGGGPHPCDYKDNGSSGGFANGGTSSGTPTTALRDAALGAGLEFDAEWFGSGKENGNPGDFFVSRVGSDVNETAPPFASWGYAVNDTTAPVGGCQIALSPGSEVLWAYNYFNLTHRLRLSGGASATAGTPFVVHVTDGQTGEALSGAVIGQVAGGITTPLSPAAVSDAAGNASVTRAGTGTLTLKATRAESVRSNGLAVCVHNGNDGTCGTTVPSSPAPQTVVPPAHLFEEDIARISGIRNGAVFRRRSAPRLLAGTVEVRAGGTLRQVSISLARRYRGRCSLFSGSRAKFMRTRKCGKAGFFSVGSAQSFSYLLPAPLPPGRYVFEMKALESSGRTTKLVDGMSRVAFRVR